MRSEVRPPPPLEEKGPQFHHCQISDLYKMCRSGDRVGLSGLTQVRVGQGWFILVKVLYVWLGWVGQGGEDLWLGWVGVGGWVVSSMGKKNKCSNENEFILYHN